jgi:hypothetical protein
MHAAEGPPVILQQPVNVAARRGETATFSFVADGSQPLTISWLRNGQLIASGPSTNFVTAPLRASDDGAAFSAVVMNDFGQVVTSNAFLTVDPGIVVAASVNRGASRQFYRGWPFMLEVTLIHPSAFEPDAVPILIAADSGPCFNALRVEVRNSQDQPQSWPFHQARVTNETVQLTSESGGRMTWWLTPEQSAQLPLGAFSILVALNTTNVNRPGAWKGLLPSVPVALSISDEPATLTPAQTEQKHRLLAEYALLSGNRAQAQREVDSLLAAYPTNIAGLVYDAFLKRDSGLFDAAFASITAALSQVNIQSPDAQEPPDELLAMQADLYPIVAPPLLQSTLAGQQLLISWDGHPTVFSYRLEASVDLKSWSIVTTNFSIISNRFSTSASLAPGHRFFRVVR